MRYSDLLIPTTREVPAEAEIPSHQLMLRAGFMRKVSSGAYTYLPLGWRSLRKIMEIVREEMDAAGAQEILMPALQPMELWARTGRDADYGETMCRFQDRHGRMNVLAPTAEEVVTSLVAAEINSYKQLPVNLYQISAKFRDEFRPRYGVLRSREFIMKDAYSFDTSIEALGETYQKMYDAYCRIFTRCGLQYVIVEAESGPIGGSASHEFMVPCENGEDVIVHTADGSYAANIEKAEVDPLPKADPVDAPAPKDVHTPDVGTIEAVCAFLGTQPEQMIKTLVYWRASDEVKKELQDLWHRINDVEFSLEQDRDRLRHADADSLNDEAREEADEAGASVQVHQADLDDLESQVNQRYKQVAVVVALVRGNHEINEAKLAHAAGGQIEFADERTIERVTGAAVGFAGPIGLADKVDTLLIDHGVAAMAVGVSGANKTDHHTKNVVPGRDFPVEGKNVVVADIRNATEGDTHGGEALQFSRGIEIGHVFKLGTNYSEALGATYLDENGQAQPAIMGCYGIGINRILAGAIELTAHPDGPALPITIAPFEIEVVQLNNDSPRVVATAGEIADKLTAAGVEVLLDDRDARPGVKFKDADLIGIPLRIVVGEKALKDGNVELKRRTDAKPTLVPVAGAVAEARAILDELRAACTP